MKPVSLEISGLNSFRKKQTIDFDALLHDRLFGIFGPTGSGKSTILDAITLALYGQVERAQGGKSGIINALEKRCSVCFTFEIERDGVRRSYAVERVLERPKNRPNGAQTKSARLVENDGATERVIADKQTDIDARILELLGIEYREFVRAVVLPQGSFADFLKLPSKDRSAALQRLFGLHELGSRLSVRLKAQADDMKSNRAGLEGRLAELRSFDDDAVAAHAKSVEGMQMLESSARDAHRDASTRLADAESLRAMLADLAAIELEQLRIPDLTSALEEKRAVLDHSSRAASIAPSIATLDRAARRVGDIDATHATAVESLSELRPRLVDAKARFAEADCAHAAAHLRTCEEISMLESVKRDLEDIATSAARVDQSQRECERLRAIRDETLAAVTELRGQITSNEAALATMEIELSAVTVSSDERELLGKLNLDVDRLRERERIIDERERSTAILTRALDDDAARLAELQNEELGCGAELSSAQMQIQLLRGIVDELRKDCSSVAEQVQHLRAVHALVRQLEAQREEIETRSAATRTSIEKQNSRSVVLEHQMNSMDERQKTLSRLRQQAFDRLHDAHHRNALATLAPQLHDHQACPLCGSLEHPAPHRSASGGDADLEQLRSALLTIENDLATARSQFSACSLEKQEITTTRQLEQQSLDRDVQSITSINGKIADAVASSSESIAVSSVADLGKVLAAIEASEASMSARLVAAELRLGGFEERIPALQQTSSDCATRRAAFESSIRVQTSQLLEARNAAASLRFELDELRNHIVVTSDGRSIDDIELAIARMSENDRSASLVRDRIADEQRRVAALRDTAFEKSRMLSDQETNHAAFESVLIRDRAELQRRRSTAYADIAAHGIGISHALIDEHDGSIASASHDDSATLTLEDLDTLIAARVLLRDQLAADRAQAEAMLGELSSDEKVLQSRVEHLANDLARERSECERVDSECAALLAKFGFSSLGDVRKAALSDEEEARLREDVRRGEQEIRSINERRDALERRIDGRTIYDEEFASVRRLRDEATVALEEAIGMLAAARGDLERVRERNAEYHRFTGENADAIGRQQTIERLGRYLQGDAFINFLADERLADVCRRATRMLEDLTGGRYEIFSTPTDGFMVRDMSNGGFVRPPGSLSGGETFIVSLSLALALSDTIQMGRAPLEFFFLDEGFGTLDAELLDAVVDTLERLRSGHRTIGLITHVGSLRERIPRRLVVSAPMNGVGTQVQFEVA